MNQPFVLLKRVRDSLLVCDVSKFSEALEAF